MIFLSSQKKTCDTAILESKTKMSGNDGSHNQRFHAEAEEFYVEMINDLAERYLKEKCSIFDNEDIVPEQTLNVIEASKKISEQRSTMLLQLCK